MDGAVGAGPSGTIPQASDQPLAGLGCALSKIKSTLLQWNEIVGLPSTRNRTEPKAGHPPPALEVESNPSEGRGNSDDRRSIPAKETVAACALAGARGDSIKDGMTVSSAENERKSTRTTDRSATQDRRLGNPGKKRPGKGTKPKRGGAQRPLPGGEGVTTSTLSGSSPSARRDDPGTATSAPQIARQGDIS
jgi:hypothetical protein